MQGTNLRENKFKILFITNKKLDWIVDYIYQGLFENGQQIFEFPLKDSYHKSIKKNSYEYDPNAMLKSNYPYNRLSARQLKNLLTKNYFNVIITTTKTFHYKDKPVSDFLKWLKYQNPVKKNEIGWRNIYKYRKFINIPIIAIDGTDKANILKGNLPLLNVSTIYFKREIPFDKSLLYNKLNEKDALRVKNNLQKIKSIPIGINLNKFHQLFPGNKSKTIDIAYLMNPQNNPLREKALLLLKKLKYKYNIYFSNGGAKTGLNIKEYMEIIKSSKITLSISGLGWDCKRHYEVPASKSALMVNEPTIYTYNFFEDGKSAIFFKNDLSDFEAKLEYYLTNSEYLTAITTNGYEHLSKYLDIHRTADYILEGIAKFN